MAHKNFLNVKDYIPLENDVFLVDTNVLIGLFTQFGDLDKLIGKQYGEFIQKRSPKLVITSMILSEFISTNLKKKYRIYNELNGTNLYYKEYRKLPEFKKEIEHLKLVIERQVLKIVDKIDDNFTDVNAMACFNPSIKSFDFSDRYYVELAKKNSIKILTNDSDFCDVKDVDIVTANPKFFKQ